MDPMSSGKQVALVVGASRGIGRQIAISLAAKGYAVVVAAKSTSDATTVTPFPPDPNSQLSTINTVEREIREAGGDAAAVAVDTRDLTSIQHLVNKTVGTYGRLDILVYNSGAIWWASVEDTPTRRFQLMQQVNAEGLYGMVQAVLPHFEANGWNGRIIVVSPPIYSRFFRGKTAYAMGKVAMSVLTKGLAMDFERQQRHGMSITSIWPATAIESAATGKAVAGDASKASELRKPTIFADAVLSMLEAPAPAVNGLLEIDEDFLRNYHGVSDFSKYALVQGTHPRRIMPVHFPNLRVDEQDDEGRRVDSLELRRSKL